MPRKSNQRDGDAGWFASLLGAVVLIIGGFALGLVAGVVSEEPGLVVEHLAGRGEQIAWLPDAESELAGTDETGAVAALPTFARNEEAADSEPPKDLPEAALPLPAVAAPPARVLAGDPVQPAPVAAIRQAPTSPSESAGRVGFAVQVGAFVDAGAADRVYQQLRGKGFDAYIISASKSGDGRSRVRVGPVESKADAQALAARLKREERLPTWVLSGGGS